MLVQYNRPQDPPHPLAYCTQVSIPEPKALYQSVPTPPPLPPSLKYTSRGCPPCLKPPLLLLLPPRPRPSSISRRIFSSLKRQKQHLPIIMISPRQTTPGRKVLAPFPPSAPAYFLTPGWPGPHRPVRGPENEDYTCFLSNLPIAFNILILGFIKS